MKDFTALGVLTALLVGCVTKQSVAQDEESTYWIEASIQLDPNGIPRAQAALCDPGDVVVDGGCELRSEDGNRWNAYLITSRSAEPKEGWVCVANTDTGQEAAPTELWVFAECEENSQP